MNSIRSGRAFNPVYSTKRSVARALAQNLPVGLQRDELGRVQKDSDREVQQRIGLIFQTFFQVRSATKVLGSIGKGYCSLVVIVLGM